MVEAADVSDAAAVQAMMERVRLAWGGLDILVNNAGIFRDRSIAKMTLEEWRAVIDVNLTGVFHCSKYGLEILRDGGSIVCVGSLSAKLGAHGQSNYAAAKAGVQALVRVFARECARRKIRVNAVAPGAIDTAMIASVAEKAREHLASAIALGRMGQPAEVASAVLFLCSPWPATSPVTSWKSTAVIWDNRKMPVSRWWRTTVMGDGGDGRLCDGVPVCRLPRPLGISLCGHLFSRWALSGRRVLFRRVL